MGRISRPQPGDFDVLMELILTDKNGKVQNKRKMRCESFTRQFIDALLIAMAFSERLTSTDMGGTSAYLAITTTNINVNASSSDDTRGILIGTGTTSVAVDDYTMETLIADGTGTGQLQYSAVSFGEPVNTGTTQTSFIISRVFTNGSGAQIDVSEAGLVCFLAGNVGLDEFLILHDIIDPVFAVTDTSSLTLNYTFRTTV